MALGIPGLCSSGTGQPRSSQSRSCLGSASLPTTYKALCAGAAWVVMGDLLPEFFRIRAQ